ncbi:MAG: hypothetical protein ACRDQ5_14280 [Sciscionella sp.]
MIAATVILLVLGSFLLGWTWAIEAYDQRSRRQAALQRELNAERRALHAPSRGTVSDQLLHPAR